MIGVINQPSYLGGPTLYIQSLLTVTGHWHSAGVPSWRRMTPHAFCWSMLSRGLVAMGSKWRGPVCLSVCLSINQSINLSDPTLPYPIYLQYLNTIYIFLCDRKQLYEPFMSSKCGGWQVHNEEILRKQYQILEQTEHCVDARLHEKQSTRPCAHIRVYSSICIDIFSVQIL